ncbi:MAG: NERD domain-containing protein [Hyphomonadaceae bacterium]|nr:NERD domain-containing protein [Hyphomonadaceae bacterium]
MTGRIHFFRGAPVDVKSEMVIARALNDLLPDGAIVAVNFVVHGRQIDLVAVTSTLCLVIEAKESIWPIEGAQNGAWRVVTPQRPVPTRNAYRQALDAKYALRDALIAWRGQPVGYPNAAVVYAPALPAGSNLPVDDYRVHLAQLSDLDAELVRASEVALPLADWRAFFQSLGLEEVDDVGEVFDPRLETEGRLLSLYAEAFRAEYGPAAAEWTPDPDAAVNDVLAGAPGILLGGPSGCGKSLLAQKLAVEIVDRGGIPIFLAGKNFSGNWRESIAREVGLLVEATPDALLRSARRQGREVLFVLDALNEIASDRRDYALRGLTALSRRNQARFVLSSNPMPPATVIPSARRIELRAPSAKQKEAIATKVLGRQPEPLLVDLLRAVQTGFEAKLAAEVGARDLERGRYALFERFARLRLAEKAAEGVSLLANFAAMLIDQVTFSLSERAFEQLELSIGRGVGALLQSAGFIERRAQRVSFVHELFLQAFGAESLVRWANQDAGLIALALSEPINIERRSMIIGAIDQADVVERVLAGSGDTSILAAAGSGECGRLAADVTANLFEACFRKLEREIASLRAKIVWEEGRARIQFEGLEPWSPIDRARLSAIAKLAARDDLLDRVLAISALLDTKLRSERQRLLVEARDAGLGGLRSAFFQSTYVMALAGEVGFEVLVSATPDWSTDRRVDTGMLAARLAADDLTDGQAYILLRIARTQWGDKHIARVLPALFDKLWRTAPYHLKLDLLGAAQFCRSEDAEVTQAIVDAINRHVSNAEHVFITTSAVDALRSLGALEEDGEAAREGIREELERLAANADDANLYPAAWGAYGSRFDHPYDWVYYEEWEALTPSLRSTLLRMAVQGAPEFSFFLNAGLTELAELRDVNDIDIFRMHARVPDQSNSIPQDAMKVFVVANMALGLLGQHDQSETGQDEVEDILITVGGILRVARAPEITTEVQDALTALWTRLEAKDVGRVVGILADVSEAITQRDETPRRVFGEPSLAVPISQPLLRMARRVLDEGIETHGYFEFRDRKMGFLFAVQIVSQHGDLSDLTRLRRAAARPDGQAALDVVRKFEQRL